MGRALINYTIAAWAVRGGCVAVVPATAGPGGCVAAVLATVLSFVLPSYHNIKSKHTEYNQRY